MDDTGDLSNLSITFLFSILLRYQKKYFNNHYLKKHHITMVHIPIIMTLYKKNSPIYQKDISKLLCIDTALITRYLHRLEQEQIIESREDEENRRQKMIKLTPKGQKLGKKIHEEEIKYENKLIKNITTREELTNILIEMIKSSKKQNKKEQKEVQIAGTNKR